MSHDFTGASNWCCYYQENDMYTIGWGSNNYIKGNNITAFENGIII